ncbi:DNA replication regulator SLD3-domain-containing protein [Aspergillus crustosus]
MASRGSPTILEPIPLNHLRDDPQALLKKRKRPSVSDGLSTDNIVIRAHAASLSDEPYILEPIAVIPRFQFPFSWLDASSALSQIQSGSLFVANIPALETELHPEPVVLTVRLRSDGGLYVIERVKRGIYSLSKLARGVEEGDIRVAVKAASRRLDSGLGPCMPCNQADAGSEDDWWRGAQIDDPNPGNVSQGQAKRPRINFVFGVASRPVGRDERRKDILPVDENSSGDVHMVSVPPESQLTEAVVSGEVNPHSKEPVKSPQELLDGLREQYLQALYVSKASVAYFAKGPLPRCKAAFQSPDSSVGSLSDLTGFYRAAILTAKKMDLKYRETLPTTLHDIVLSISDDEMTAPKKRKSKKKTLGRNGLYAEEQDFIRRWWKNRALTETGSSAETSRDAEIKKHVSDLRLRETHLQILLILETIALEATAAEAKRAGNTEDATEMTPQKPKTKSKNSQDLNTMLELHLDRLCIWHAVSFDNVSVSESQASGRAQLGKTGSNDAMRDFCTEVIIPFYASRLPDRCKSITRKLGVSASSIPAFLKSAKKPTHKETAAVERKPLQKQSRRTLHRVLTDEQSASHGRSQPSLNRSITAPSQIETKRETTPLLPSLSASVRGGIQKAKRAENREVDLFAVARQHETKLKRNQLLADQKKELDAAILALRKPNRELVAKDIAQDVEKRLTSSSSRKPKNPVRNPLGEGVQVMATPSKVRKRDADAGLPSLQKHVPRSKPKTLSSSFSSPFNAEPQVIPASTIRPTSFSGPTYTADVAIQETPSRRPSQPPNSFNDPSDPNIAKSPIPGTGTGSGNGNLFRIPRRPAIFPAPSLQPTETAPITPIRTHRVDITNIETSLDDNDNNNQTRLPPPPPPLFALPTRITPSAAAKSSSMVFETPPNAAPVLVPNSVVKGNGNGVRRPSIPISSTFPTTSGLGSGSKIGQSKPPPPPVVPVTPEKSIYASLGWDDEEDDELAM